MRPKLKMDGASERSIWLRPSQIKIKYPPQSLDPAHLVVEVLRHSHFKTPGRLASDIIINMNENQVPKEAFMALLRDGLEKTLSGLLTWEGPQAMEELWMNVAKIGGMNVLNFYVSTN
jgi:RNA-dependent RNA polymerase